MTNATSLDRTLRYLRFPFAEDHRTKLQDGSACPHCSQRHIQKWGRQCGRQRYRCCHCGRTFSTFTGTALYYLKRPELWPRFLWCVDGRLTVRKSGALLAVDKDTALRWRHRLLDQWRRAPRRPLSGRITVGYFWMPHSAKGSRPVDRPARTQGEPWSFPGLQTSAISVLVAMEESGPLIMKSLVAPRLRAADYDRELRDRVRDVGEIVGCRGEFDPLASFARTIGATYVTERRSFFPRRVFIVRRELRAWLRPFRGVSTRRLDNYLEWFRRRGWEFSRPIPTVPTDRAKRGAPGLAP